MIIFSHFKISGISFHADFYVRWNRLSKFNNLIIRLLFLAVLMEWKKKFIKCHDLLVLITVIVSFIIDGFYFKSRFASKLNDEKDLKFKSLIIYGVFTLFFWDWLYFLGFVKENYLSSLKKLK